MLNILQYIEKNITTFAKCFQDIHNVIWKAEVFTMVSCSFQTWTENTFWHCCCLTIPHMLNILTTLKYPVSWPEDWHQFFCPWVVESLEMGHQSKIKASNKIVH